LALFINEALHHLASLPIVANGQGLGSEFLFFLRRRLLAFFPSVLAIFCSGKTQTTEVFPVEQFSFLRVPPAAEKMFPVEQIPRKCRFSRVKKKPKPRAAFVLARSFFLELRPKPEQEGTVCGKRGSLAS
jgi:hypothetical protein